MILVAAALLTLAVTYYLFMSPWSQVFGSFPYRVKTKERLVALTFDDGPNEPHTSQILDILDANNASGTFFQVGSNVERHPHVTKRISNSRHELGNHSLTHNWKHFSIPSNKFAKSEVQPTQKIFETTVGELPVLFRPPWLWRTPSLIRRARDLGLVSISGTFSSIWEVTQPSAKIIARSTLKKIKPGAIIIFHDGSDAHPTANRAKTVEAVEEVVKKLRVDGWEMVTVSELLSRQES